MKAGTYYIGDLCYLADVWEDILDIMHGGTGMNKHETEDGKIVEFAQFRTMYGDGTYDDQEGRRYDVDSGTIGCYPVSKYIGDIWGGNIIEFEKDFTVSKVDGVLKFGHIEINTKV